MNSENKKYCFIAVEGVHDQAAIGKLLEQQNLSKYKGDIRSLDKFWKNLIPDKFPPEENIYERISLPSIYYSSTHSIAIFWGNGEELKQNLIDTFYNNENYVIDVFSLGIILDADDENIEEKVKNFVTKKTEKEPKLSVQDFFNDFPLSTANITKNEKRFGNYVLPNNNEVGTLDRLLLECANEVYPKHKDCAISYIECIEDIDENIKDKLLRGFNKDKALVATIVSVLKPGKTNQASISDDKWICKDTIEKVEDLGKLNDFLVELLDLGVESGGDGS